MKECYDCKSYKDCAGKAWYTYGEIRWCPYQVIWIIKHSSLLMKGEWPHRPDYAIGSIFEAGLNSEAYFTRVTEILAEVEIRLKTTKEAGEALVDEIQNDSVVIVMEGKKSKIQGLSRPAMNVLLYIKGNDRKDVSYPRWKANKKQYEGK